MSRSLVWLALLVSCGGTKPTTSTRADAPPDAAEGVVGVYGSADLVRDASHAEPRSSVPPRVGDAAFYARLRDDGPVPGVPDYAQRRTPDPTRCGGERVTITHGKQTLTPDEDAVAAMYRIEFPTGLDFSPAAEHAAKKDASLKTFNDWIAKTSEVGKQSQAALEAKLVAATDAAVKAEYLVRLALLSLRYASLLARAEIPRDVRTGEFATDKIEVFCGRLVESAEALIERAEAALAKCRPVAARVPTAWWARSCTAP